MSGAPTSALVWFRRDLRHVDHAALDAACRDADRVWCVFVFDREILDALPSRADRRVEFIHASVGELEAALRAQGGGLVVLHDRARTAIPALARALDVDAVYASRDHEPAARARDEAVRVALAREGRRFVAPRDQVIFDPDELLTSSGTPYTVYTPYRRAWLRALALAPERLLAHPTRLAGRLAPPRSGDAVPALESLGFERTNLRELATVPGMTGARAALEGFCERIGEYARRRDLPAVKGPSYLSVHLRFGTVSIREAARRAVQIADGDAAAAEGARTWLAELVWREFFMQVLHHHPHVVERAFKPAYDAIRWRDDEARYAAWCAGRTGYPFVDAGMRQLAHTGWMHNRLRMVTASFLAKDLGLDWRWGERWFARQLLDYELASNNGNWQWAASTGCDAQPWFRIFNPVVQSRRFDPQARFIARYVPELAQLPERAAHAPWQASPQVLSAAGVRLGHDYPAPIADHDEARRETLARYGVVRRVD